MKRLLLSFLAIFFPWIIILIDNKPIGAFANLALQLTFVGWIPACIWAFKTLNKLLEAEKNTNGSETSQKTQETIVDNSTSTTTEGKIVSPKNQSNTKEN